jgi:hypothetical protein
MMPSAPVPLVILSRADAEGSRESYGACSESRVTAAATASLVARVTLSFGGRSFAVYAAQDDNSR